jgi:hypothetical protein
MPDEVSASLLIVTVSADSAKRRAVEKCAATANLAQGINSAG